MRLKSNFFLYVILLQCSSLFSYEFSCGNHDKNNIPHAEIHVNNHYDTSPKNNWHFSAHVSEVSNYSDMQPANYSVLFCQGSPELQSYFHNKITPLIYFTTIQNHCCALPGYYFLMIYVADESIISIFRYRWSIDIRSGKTRLEIILYSYRKCFV